MLRDVIEMLTVPPTNWTGTISDFVDRFVVTNFPSADTLVAWTEAILTYYSGPNPICIVRGPRKGHLRADRVVDSDNAPGIWCYLRALDRRFGPAELAGAIEAGRVPVLKMLKTKGRSWTWNYAKEALDQVDADIIWGPKLKHCHMAGVREQAGVDPRQRAMRNLAPVNHFVFPNGNKHFDTVRLGWTESPAPTDLGESLRIIGLVQHGLLKHLGPEGARVYRRYLRAIGSELAAQPPDGRISITPRAQAAARPEASGGAVRGGRPPPRGSPGGATPRRWTLNAKQGYYVRTGETAVSIALSLSYKARDGRVQEVGDYVLDLDDLSRRGVVTRRGAQYDIKIVREAGSYWLAVRATPRLRLDDFAV